MKLGARLTLITALLMAVVLGLSALILVGVRRSELQHELADHAREMASVAAQTLEPLKAADARALLDEQAATLADRLGTFTLDTISVGAERPADPGWAQLFEAAAIDEKPVGRFFNPNNRPPFYAMAIPIHDGIPSEIGRRRVAILGIRRDTARIESAVRQTVVRGLPLIALATGLFGAVVFLILRGSVVRPLRRLNDGIDAVAAGDLSRAVLPQRDDEIGLLAGRFNRMTESLREARAEQARATSARVALEARLRHSEKLATMGQMAAQIAHEVGTPLNVIGGRARSLAKRAGDPAEVHKNAEIISSQVERITRIIHQVLNFSRKSRPTLTQVVIAHVLHESLGFMKEALGRQRIEIRLDIPADFTPIPGDPGEIQQVCLNLLHNAVHAMPGGGILELRLSTVHRRKEGLALSEPALYQVIEIGDSGPGVPSTDRDRIFEPFFTTKDSGEGTGLGLAVAQGIVADHAGWLEVGDRAGGGAVFRVFLPVLSPETALAEPAPMREDQDRV